MSPDEAREAILERPYWSAPGPEGTTLVYGLTHGGRHLLVSVIAEGEEAVVIAARDMKESWDDSYAGETPPPWDIGRPQPAFVRLADEGRLRGHVLDAGCGTGEHALLAASRGADVLGIDLSPTAIASARAKAAERGVSARFEVADALDLPRRAMTVDTVIDSAVLHVLDAEDRAEYVASLAGVLRPGGMCYLICFSDRQPGKWGPHRFHAEELRAAFSDGWTVESLTADTFELNPFHGVTQAQAWLAVIQRK
ncbi:class I SAM-dependent methyltransferase [Actinoallomurus rhizosphaericola]|uniref:class I SAM-dependent methyltransferase n=1 Tax=Actinoallomurus rhizosphaericola TaxID=2952536 RepID=UPI0020932C35|nr:class I SAM-dependent methyltransferase [Actinoallomurus rhizosphaericola]MCO5998058.1 class I SAM-dependent methyltransferase [Actinoallomurus rhizosphaericola]